MKLAVLWQEDIGVDRKKIETEIKSILVENGIQGDCLMSVIFTGSSKVHELNKTYMGKDKPTDVLSFPLDKEIGVDGKVRLGDIVVNEDYADQAEKLVLHGVLHLIGVHHH